MIKKAFLLAAIAAAAMSCGKDSDPGTGVTINGVTWATANVAAPKTFAARPESAGMFYQWGNNVGWSTTDPLVPTEKDRVWGDGFVFGEVWAVAFDPCPDGWRVPTNTEWETLLDEAKVVNMRTTRGGVDGQLFMDATSDRSIFLPAAGNRGFASGELSVPGEVGSYWASSAQNEQGDYLNFDSFSQPVMHSDSKACGRSVRCVRE
jgi:uncharacterized protein (TIGR02145 family)